MSTPRDRIEAKLGLTGPPLERLRESPPAIPDHELVRRIGQGAYGEVWLARNALGTWRAVKVVYRDSFQDERPYEREFAGIRRFEPLSRSNEGFVDILQVGRDEAGGWFYYVMELADPATSPNEEIRNSDSYQPRTLALDLAQRSRLPLEDCLQLGLTLTLALGQLHRHGLIHRDVKPSNIIYVGGVPKLADIGLVTEAQGANTFVGTEGFVPPEGPTSPQADLYALGKVLYEAAMGKDRNEFPEPFTQISTDRESVALMELNAVLLRACAPDPRKRYASADEMHADLALLHSGGSVKRRHQFDRQFQFARQVGGVAIATTLLIGSAWLWQRQQTQKMTRLAEEKTALATEKTTLAESLSRLGEENRNRIVRLDIANGARLLDEGDPAGALLWFADALPLVTNKPAEEAIHRIRIQQVLNQTPRLLHLLPHEHAASSMAFSSDGRRIATGTQAGEVCVWDVKSGTRLWEPIRFCTNGISQLRFTRDNRRLQASSLASGSFAREGSTSGVVVIDLATGQPVFSVLATNLVCAEFSPEDQWLVTADTHQVIRVLDAQRGQVISQFDAATHPMGFSMSTNGILASTGEDHALRLWRLPSGEPIPSPLDLEKQWHGAVLSPDGRVLITGKSDDRELGSLRPYTPSVIQRWDVRLAPISESASRMEIRRVGEPIELSGQIRALTFLPNATHRLFLATGDSTRVLDLEDNSRSPPPLEAQQISSWSLGAAGRTVALGEAGERIRLYDLGTGQPNAPPLRQAGLVDTALFDWKGTTVLAAATDQAVALWDLSRSPEDVTDTLNGPVPARRAPQTLLHRFSPDRRRFLLVLAGGAVELINTTTLQEETLAPHNPSAHRCLFAPDNRQWAIAFFNSDEFKSPCVELWREDNSGRQRLVLPHPRTVEGLQFDSAGSHLITTCGDARIRLWSTADGMLMKTTELPPDLDIGGALFPSGRSALFYTKSGPIAIFDVMAGSITGVLPWTRELVGWQLDPRGSRFVTINRDGIGHIWRLPTGEPLTPPLRHGGELHWVEWSPDGTRVLTSGTVPEAKVWDATTGNEALLPLRLGSKPLETAQWSLDGRFIVARSDENVVRVWDASTGDPVTPLLKHTGYVRLAHLVANNRLLTLTLPDLLRAWDLTETRLPADVVRDYARLLSGRDFNAAGEMVPLQPAEAVVLSRSLRVRAPQLF